jgi:hypothetical protein
MPVGVKQVQDPPQPMAGPEAAAIREQLERLLAHPLFSNSKRYRCYSRTRLNRP